MKKSLIVLTALMLVLSLLAGINVPSTKAFEPVSPISHVKDYISQNVVVPSNVASQKAGSLKLPTELIDGIEIPKSLAETKHVKNGEDYVKVAIDGLRNPTLTFARENNISINSSSLSPTERSVVVDYLDQTRAEHDSIKQSLAGLPVTVKNDLYVAYNGVIVETQIKNISALYTRFGKNRVHIEQIYTTNDDYSNQLVGATEAWTDPGVDGTGMYVGVVDTGVDYNHPDLGGGWGNKVVAGYDFGDKDSDPMDCQGHGTHVSGIMAADGQVKGVAPKAKIVIAKIVSGCEGSASTLDIAAAFDYMADPLNLDNGPEGTHPPVAAVNMSFGADAGFVTSDEPDQVAIEACVNAGIFVSLSAGNAYYSYYNFGYYPFFPDFSMVGSPSVTPSAMSVAASYNSYGIYPALTKIAPTPSANYAYLVGSASPDPVTTLGDNSGVGYPYVYCGYGSAAEVPASVSGKIALMSRGNGISFYVKINNAAAKGAIGAIIFNNTSGYISMDTTGQANIPAVSISRSDGLALRAYAENYGDGTGRIGFRSNTYVGVPQATDTMVDFSSWGPSPDLSFKPEITAPGGGIWSTVPIAQGSYANYSGTSMASPHVAAIGALVKEAHPDWSPSQIKVALMNTAKILYNGSLPDSVLKQGAGRVDAYSALHTNVFVTDVSKGNPYIPLGELPSYKVAPVVFNVRLTNTGSSPETYSISWTNPQTVGTNLKPMALNGAIVSVTPSQTITVPANGTTDIAVTMDLTSVPDWNQVNSDQGWNYIEGFIKFAPTSGPELHIPYMGVLGKWNDFTNQDAWDFNPLIDLPPDEPMGGYSYYLAGTPATWPELTNGIDYWNYAGLDFDGNYDRNAIAFNPGATLNGKNELLEVDFWTLRNIQNVIIEVRDQSDHIVRTIENADYLYKMGWYSNYNNWWVWDGKDSSGNPVPDGKYKLVIKATPPKIFNKLTYDAPQVIEFPVSIDRIDPLVNITNTTANNDGTFTVSWTPATDLAPSSGIWGYEVDWYDIESNPLGYELVPPNTTSYTISGLPKGSYYIAVWAIDNAGNASYDLAPCGFYTITSSVNNASWGTIAPLGKVNVPYNGSQSFTITPNTGYNISNILVDGAPIFGSEVEKPNESTSYIYTFENVTYDHTIQAVFAPGTKSYVIKATAHENGTIAPTGDVLVAQFASQTFTITPNSGYHIKDVVVDNVYSVISSISNVYSASTYTFENVTSSHTIDAYFAINTYSLKINTSGLGTVARSPSSDKDGKYEHGTVVTLTAIPGPGYYFIGWSGDITGMNNPATITMNSDKAVTAIFSTTPASYFTLHIPKGWSVISVPFTTAVSTIKGNANIQYLYYWDGFCWDDPTTLNPGAGYLVYNKSSSTIDITLTGTQTTSPFTIPSTGSWEVIGNPFTTSCTLTSTSTIIYIYYWDGFWKDANPNNLQPGMGYLIYTATPGTLTFTPKP